MLESGQKPGTEGPQGALEADSQDHLTLLRATGDGIQKTETESFPAAPFPVLEQLLTHHLPKETACYLVSEKAQGKICSGTRSQEWQLRHRVPSRKGHLQQESGSLRKQLPSDRARRGLRGDTSGRIQQQDCEDATLSLYLRARLLMAITQVSWSWGECDPGKPRFSPDQTQQPHYLVVKVEEV